VEPLGYQERSVQEQLSRIPLSQEQSLQEVAIHHRPQIAKPLDRYTDPVERLRVPHVCFGPDVQKELTNEGQHHDDNTPKHRECRRQACGSYRDDPGKGVLRKSRGSRESIECEGGSSIIGC